MKKTVETVEKNISSSSQHAFCIGINDYPGTHNDLRGCVNDARDWANLFRVQGYSTEIITDKSATVLEGRKILTKLVELSHKYGPEFKGVLQFSGHGTHVLDRDGDEINGRDEALCMYNGLIIDDEIRGIFQGFHKDANLWIITDCCHSGTITRQFMSAVCDSPVYIKPRYMPPEDAMSVDLNLRAKHSIVQPLEEDMNEILLTGCLDTEYSYDAYIDSKFQGAMSYFAKRALRHNPNMTFEQLHQAIKRSLPSRNFPQTPQLEGKDQNKSSLIF